MAEQRKIVTAVPEEPQPTVAVPPAASVIQVSAEEKMREATDLMKAGKVKEGLAILEAMTKVEPVDPRVYLYRGIALKRLDRKAEAVASFKKAAAGSPAGSNVRSAAQKYLDELSGKKVAP